MSKLLPLVSVVLPVYNNETYIEDAIKSILNQTYKNLELLIIDDASVDSSLQIAHRFESLDSRVKIFHNNVNLKITKALNFGINQSRGEYIVRMDADDWAYPTRIEEQVNYMLNNPDIVLSGTFIEVCSEDLIPFNIREYKIIDDDIRKILFRYNPFAHPATIWERKALFNTGLYNENLPLAQDYELYFRMGMFGKFGNLPQVLLKLRTHKRSSSRVSGRQQEIIALYTRIKAVIEFGYKMTLTDKLYFIGQLFSVFLIPREIKFWLFNFIRRYF